MCTIEEAGCRNAETDFTDALLAVFHMLVAAMVPMLETEYAKVAGIVPWLNDLYHLVRPGLAHLSSHNMHMFASTFTGDVQKL